MIILITMIMIIIAIMMIIQISTNIIMQSEYTNDT